MNALDVAKGYQDSNGVVFMWTTEPDPEVMGFDHMEDMINYVMSKMDTFSISLGQSNQKRTFTIWEMPWSDAPGPKGVSWTECV